MHLPFKVSQVGKVILPSHIFVCA